MRKIANVSYGKDSLAALEICFRIDEGITDIVTADIWATPEIPAYLPPLAEFRARIDEWIMERYGIPVTHIRSPKSFEELFYSQITERSKYPGRIYGWPPIKGHWCMRILKSDPIERFFKSFKEPFVNYLGIAWDEPERFGQLNERKRSVLVEAQITEAECMCLCKDLGIASPTYVTSMRDGCWFCVCQGTEQLRILRRNYPDYWEIMKKWDNDNVGNISFKPGRTLRDYDLRFSLEDEGLIQPGDTFRWGMLDAELNERIAL